MRNCWSQKARGKLKRICAVCRRVFYCTGRCNDRKRILNERACMCPNCASKNLSLVVLVRGKIPAYQGLFDYQIYNECYNVEPPSEEEHCNPLEDCEQCAYAPQGSELCRADYVAWIEEEDDEGRMEPEG